jgi:hypothetical protein
VTGLTLGTTYNVYIVLEDLSQFANRDSSVVLSPLSATTIEDAPTFLDGTPMSSNIAQTTFDLDVVVSKDRCGVWLVVVIHGSNAPTPTELFQATAADGQTQTPLYFDNKYFATAGVKQTFSVGRGGQINAGTKYDVYLIAQHMAPDGVAQPAYTLVTVTTASLSPPPSPPPSPPSPPPQPPPHPPPVTNSTDTASNVATRLRDAASAKSEEAAMKKKEATEKRAAADQKQQDATIKRVAANAMKKDADAKKARAQNTRDSMLGVITDVKKKKKARLLADAAIAGVNVTKVKANFIAASEAAACDDAYLQMDLLSTLGACDVNNAISGRRRLLADTAYLVEILLSSAEVNQRDIDAALTSLSAAGVTAEISKEDALVLLSAIPGIDTTIVRTLQSEATAAATAIATAEAAETDTVATESAAAVLETDAAAAEKIAVDLATEATYLDNEATVAASLIPPPPSSPPPPKVSALTPITLPPSSSSSSPIAAIVGALVGLGLIGPTTVFSIMYFFFKPYLRRKLLWYGFKRLANLLVPDLEGDVRLRVLQISQPRYVIVEMPSDETLCIGENCY